MHSEFKAYTQLVRALSAEERSTLGFWKTYEHRFPIIVKVAHRVECVSGTSCDVERLFSHAGLICSAIRNRLLPKTIQCLPKTKKRSEPRHESRQQQVVRNVQPPWQVRSLCNLPIHTLVIVTVRLAIFSVSLCLLPLILLLRL